MAEILNAHGSKNDIFVAAMTPRDFASDEDLRAFVRRLCDRAGPFGGDGIYLYDAAPPIPEAWVFNHYYAQFPGVHPDDFIRDFMSMAGVFDNAGRLMNQDMQQRLHFPIALTPQLVARYRARFGDDVAVIHSHLTPKERHGMWHKLRASKLTVAIGARSAFFAPVASLPAQRCMTLS